jgi:hypothetical protein
VFSFHAASQEIKKSPFVRFKLPNGGDGVSALDLTDFLENLISIDLCFVVVCSGTHGSVVG